MKLCNRKLAILLSTVICVSMVTQPILAATVTEEVIMTEDSENSGKELNRESRAEQSEDILIDEENFPDEEFLDFLQRKFGEILTKQEIEDTTELDCSCNPITSLEGIQYFTNLKKLNCSENDLSSLNLSNCVSLEELNCSFNNLSDLDIRQCVNLEKLNCSFNNLSDLDIRQCVSLEELNCSVNKLNNLDIRDCVNLRQLECSDNNLKNLNISQSIRLTKINCNNNNLSELNVNNCENLKILYCSNNQISTLDISPCRDLEYLFCESNELIQLDVSKCINLEILNCSQNILRKLDVAGHKKLLELYCNDNKINELNVDQCTTLDWIYCSNNKLSNLDVSGCPASRLYCSGNMLQDLELPNKRAVRELELDQNIELSYTFDEDTGVNTLDISEIEQFSDLVKILKKELNATQEEQKLKTTVPLEGNVISCKKRLKNRCGVTGWAQEPSEEINSILYQITFVERDTTSEENAELETDVQKGVSPKEESFSNGNPKGYLQRTTKAGEISVDQEHFPDESFRAFLQEKFGSVLTGQNIEETTEIYCPRGVKNLEGIQYFTNLERLDCSYNEIERLDVSQCVNLRELNCYNNNLVELKLGQCVNLQSLNCGFNNLKKLDVSQCVNLVRLDCYFNDLNTLEASGCTKLEYVNCSYNFIQELDLPDREYNSQNLKQDLELLYTFDEVTGIATVDISGIQKLSDVIKTLKEELNATQKGETLQTSITPNQIAIDAVQNIGKAYDIPYHVELVDKDNPLELFLVSNLIPEEKPKPQPQPEPKPQPKPQPTPKPQRKPIKLNATSLVLQKGKTTTALKVSDLAADDKVVSWKSSNTKVVAVSSTGKMKGIKEGSAVINITTAKGLTATVKVKVQKKAVRTTKITGLSKKVKLKKGKKLKLAPVLTPITSTDKLTYKTSNKKVATITGKGVITGKKVGTAKITVKSGKKSFTVTVKVAK